MKQLIKRAAVLCRVSTEDQAEAYDAIFVYRQDRLSRSMAVFAALRAEARKVRR